MSIEKIIKKLLKEESEQVARISADDFKDILNYVNNDVASIIRLPQYKNKDIIIAGDLDLSGNQQIQLMDYIIQQKSIL